MVKSALGPDIPVVLGGPGKPPLLIFSVLHVERSVMLRPPPPHIESWCIDILPDFSVYVHRDVRLLLDTPLDACNLSARPDFSAPESTGCLGRPWKATNPRLKCSSRRTICRT